MGIETTRGDFKVVRSCDKPIRLDGTFVDLLDPGLPVLANPELGPWSLAFYKEIGAALDPKSKGGRLLYCGPGPQSVEETPSSTRIAVRSPEGTPVTLRLARRGDSVKDVQLNVAGEDRSTTVQKFEDSTSDTALFVFQTGFETANLEVGWRN
jgi:hypothetical protein